MRYCRQRYFMFSASSTTKSTLYEPLTILTSNHSGGSIKIGSMDQEHEIYSTHFGSMVTSYPNDASSPHAIQIQNAGTLPRVSNYYFKKIFAKDRSGFISLH